MSKKSIPVNNANSPSDSEELISPIEDLQIRNNQQQFTPEQIKNLGQISAYSIGKVNENLSKTFAELKSAIKPINEKINQIKAQQNMVIAKNMFSASISETAGPL